MDGVGATAPSRFLASNRGQAAAPASESRRGQRRIARDAA